MIPEQTPQPLTSLKETLSSPNLLAERQVPRRIIAPAPMTVTEAMESLLEKQNEIKAALDVLIADATTLRAQL